MARTSSDQLYQLIHSLNTEEKGYFIKFAKRYSSSGNANLQLFQAISRQKVFEEKELQKKFKSYAVNKVYLKNMIMDSLALYHRNNHPHIELLSQIQKIHVLLMKGLQVEAMKLADKAIAEAEKMEQFPLTRYLWQLKKSIQSKTLKTVPQLQLMHQEYFEELKSLDALEADLQYWDKISFDALLILRNSDVFKPGKIAVDEIKAISARPAFSKKSELLKCRTEYFLYFINGDEKGVLASSKKSYMAATDFRLHSDESYNDIAETIHYMGALGSMGKIKERIVECEKMFNRPYHDLSQKHEVLLRYVTNMCSSLLHLGRFRETLELVNTYEKPFREAVAFTGLTIMNDVFIHRKILALFLNRDYTGTWREIQLAGKETGFNNGNANYADLKMMEIMTQYMFGHYDLVRSLALKYKKEFAGRKIQSYTYQQLFKFFSTKSPLDYKKEARKLMRELDVYYTAENKFARKIFTTIRYTYWLDEISGGRTVQKALEETFGANK